MLKTKKTKSLFFSWAISYILIFSISFISCLTVYWYNGKIFEQELVESSEISLKYIVESSNSDLNETGLILRMVSDLPQTKRALELKNTSEDDADIILMNLSNQIDEIVKTYGLKDVPQIYLSDINRVVSADNVYTFEEYYEYTKGWLDDTLSLNSWRAYLTEGMGIKLRQGTDNVVFYSTTIGDASSMNLYMPGCVVIRKNSFLETEVLDRGISYAVLDRYGTPIVFSSPFYKRKIFKNFDSEKDPYIYTGGEKYLVKQTTDSGTGYTYIAMVPYSRLTSRLSRVGIINLFVLGLCFAMGLIMILLVVRRNFLPVKETMFVLKKSSVMQNDNGNELRIIADTVSRILNENTEFSIKLDAQSDMLRMHTLSNILRENSANTDLVKLGAIDFNYEYFVVSVFYIEDLGEFFNSDETDLQAGNDVTLARFAIRQITQEMLENSGIQSYYTEIEQLIAFVLCVPSPDSNYKAVLNEAKNFLDDNLKIKLTISVSDAKNTVSSLSELYLKCLDLLEYRSVSGMYTVITDDYRMDAGDYCYSFSSEEEGLLKNYILQGNSSGAIALVSRILKSCSAKNNNPDILKYISFDIVSTILKVSEAGENKTALTDMLHSFLGRTDFQSLCEIITLACNTAKVDSNGDIVRKAMKFVEHNYRNTELSISMIAENLGITSAYLSHLFNKSSNEKLLEFINRCRIEHAKELLTNPDFTIQDVALEVGYTNTKTFRRLFKKYTGMLPTEYRNSVTDD